MTKRTAIFGPAAFYTREQRELLRRLLSPTTEERTRQAIERHWQHLALPPAVLPRTVGVYDDTGRELIPRDELLSS